jgi:hypothetical protein
MSIHHLVFDASDIQTLEASHSVGAFVRSGKSGALITHHSLQKPNAVTFAFVDGDVTPASDTIAETAHGLQTGDKIQLTTTGVLPAGLALLTDYYVIRVDANTIKLAASESDAEWNIPVDITAAAGGGTHTLTAFEVEGRSLDVWISNPSLAITDGGGSITVDASNLDIRDLVFATDKVDVSGSTVELGATTLAALETITVLQGTSPWVVSATDLDIRNLDYTLDNVAIKGATGNQLVVNADGSLNVNADISIVNGSDKAEDSAHASGDIGTYILAVRQDTLASSTSADGDYGSLKTNALGRLYVDTGSVTVNDSALADVAIKANAKLLAVANTAENIITSPLANRKYLFLMNDSNKTMWIGETGVTSAQGFPLPAGSMLEMRAGAAIDIEFVGLEAGTATKNLRTLELS